MRMEYQALTDPGRSRGCPVANAVPPSSSSALPRPDALLHLLIAHRAASV